MDWTLASQFHQIRANKYVISSGTRRSGFCRLIATASAQQRSRTSHWRLTIRKPTGVPTLSVSNGCLVIDDLGFSFTDLKNHDGKCSAIRTKTRLSFLPTYVRACKRTLIFVDAMRSGQSRQTIYNGRNREPCRSC